MKKRRNFWSFWRLSGEEKTTKKVRSDFSEVKANPFHGRTAEMVIGQGEQRPL